MGNSFIKCDFCGTSNGDLYYDSRGNERYHESEEHKAFYRCTSCGVTFCSSCVDRLAKSRTDHHVFGSAEHWIQCPHCGGKIIKILDSKGQSSGSGCFITTATLKSLNKPDDCYELTLFRKFRDTWMKENHPEDVAEYYTVAPKIVDIIDKLEDASQIYSDIWVKHLKICQDLLEQNKEKEAYDKYRAMVDTLAEEYLGQE